MGISQEKIQQFVTSIQRTLDLATVFLQMYEEVSDIYHFTQPTYRIVIGKSYALFYRMSEAKKEIYVGRLLQIKQFKAWF